MTVTRHSARRRRRARRPNCTSSPPAWPTARSTRPASSASRAPASSTPRWPPRTRSRPVSRWPSWAVATRPARRPRGSADHGHPVTIVIRGEDLAASMSRYLIDRIARQPAITIMSRSAVREVDGAGRLEHVVVEDLTTSARRTLAAAACSSSIGAEAHTQWLAESIELDRHGFIVTGSDLSGHARAAHPLGRSSAGIPTWLKAACPGCSRSATYAAARSNAWLQLSARARSPFGSPMSTSAAAAASPPDRGACAVLLLHYRSARNAARSSFANRSGSSQAAK